jgi:hypothetical protein
MAGDGTQTRQGLCPTCGQPRRTSEIVERRLILGEGKDEVLFFQALLKHEGIVGVQVMDYGGKTKLSKGVLKTFKQISGFGELIALGVTRDANGATDDAGTAIDNALRDAGLRRGEAPGQPRVSVMVVEQEGKGMLEDVCLASLAERPELECVDKYLACCAEKGQPDPPNRAKARMHAWLASQDIREYQVGRAVTCHPPLLDLGHSAFDPLRAFVRAVAEM